MAETTGDLSTETVTSVTWQLRYFVRIPVKVDSVESPPFSLAGADWRLELYPNGYFSNFNSVCISIFLRRLNFSVARQRVKATFSLKNRDGKNCKSDSNDYLYEQKNDCWGFYQFISRSELAKKKGSLLPDGTLTVHCQMRVEPYFGDTGASEDESSVTDSSLERVETGSSPRQHLDASCQTETPDACKGAGDLPRTSASIQNLQTDYKKLLESKEEADVRLKVSDEESSLIALVGVLFPIPSRAHTGLHGAN